MRKTWKRALSYVLSAAMVLTAGIVTTDVKSSAAVDKSKTYTATPAMQMNTDIAVGIDEWKFNPTSEFKLGQKAVFSWDAGDSGQVAALSGNVICLDTDVPWQETGLYCKVYSVKFDGEEVPGADYSKIVFDRENAEKTTERISFQNQWGLPLPGEGVFPETYEFKTFTKLEIEFMIDDKPIVEPWFTAELKDNGGIWGWDEDNDGTSDYYSPDPSDVFTVDVTGYGDYTLRGIAGTDFSDEQGAMWVTTTLSEIPKDYIVIGKTVKVGSKTYDWSKKGKLYADTGSNPPDVRLGIWNQWGSCEEAMAIEGISGSAGDVVEFTFTVKSNATPTPPPAGTQEIGPKKGATFTSGSLKYKVTKAATMTGTQKTAGAVTVTGLAKKTAASVNVKNTVSTSGASYKVTAVGKKAFQKASKLKKATLGSAIKAIPASAFANCTKLTTVKATGAKTIAASAFKGCKALKSLTTAKLSSVKKGAFKGCKKTIKVGGKKAVKKANVKKLKKCGYKKFK